MERKDSAKEMNTPAVFISHGHKGEEWKDRVVTHLRVLEREDMLNVWDDRKKRSQ